MFQSTGTQLDGAVPGAPGRGKLLGGTGESPGIIWDLQVPSEFSFGALARGLVVVLGNVLIDWIAVGWSSARRSQAQESARRRG